MNLDTFRTVTTAAGDAPKIVIFNMAYRGTADISLIKCLRSALDCTLVAAKDLVVAAKGGKVATNIRMTSDQFGKFIAYILMDAQVSLADVRMTSVNLALPAPPPKSFDFTSLPAARPSF
jgi:hypothetical protein